MRSSVVSEQDEQVSSCNRLGRKRFTRRKLCILLVAALVILAVLLLYAANKYYTPDLDELMTRAKLTKLPESTENLQVETRPDMENDRAIPNRSILFVQFQAEPNDIDNFITKSPSIDKNSFHPLSPLDDRDQVPTWFLADQSTSGRAYHLMETDIEGVEGGTFTHPPGKTL